MYKNYRFSDFRGEGVVSFLSETPKIGKYYTSFLFYNNP